MQNPAILRIKAIFLKDLRSEFRTRYGISTISLFILTTVTMLVFSAREERISGALYSGLLWVIMFFSSMTGLSKGFVMEEEKQTSLLLKIASKPGSVYFGKLFYNVLFSITLNTAGVILFLIFFNNIVISSYLGFILIIFLGSIGIGAASTVISAIISKAGVKNSLFTVLSFPVLLPLIIVGIEATSFIFDGEPFSKIISDIQVLIAYTGILVPISYIVFDMIWEE
jgi:heme exporter protein B